MGLVSANPIISFSQKIEWSGPVSEDTKFEYVKILGSDESGFFVLKTNLPFEYKSDHYGFRKRRFALAYFDLFMHLKMQKELLPVQKELHIFKVLFAKDRVLVVNSLVNKEKKQFVISAQWINNKGTETDNIKIAEYQYLNKSELEDMEIILSKDQSLMCLLSPQTFDEPQEKQFINATAIDSNLSVVWKKQIEIPFSKKMYENQGAILSNEGALFILGHSKIFSRDNTIVPPRYFMFSFNPQKNSQTDIPVALDDYISDAGFTIDNAKKKVLIAGFYGDKTTPVIAGVFTAAYDWNSEKISAIVTKPFEIKIMDAAINLSTGQDNGNSIYPINKLVVRNDGGMVLLSEANYLTQSSYYDYFTRSFVNKVIYHYENIIAVSINPDGTMDWQQSIPKMQETQDDGGYYSSFCSLIYGTKINLIYNNAVEKSNTIYSNSINNKGIKDQKILISEADRVLLIPQSALQIDNNTLIVPAYRDRKFVYAKITF
jgi:hypothetical protein